MIPLGKYWQNNQILDACEKHEQKKDTVTSSSF